VILPTEKTGAVTDPARLNILLHGDPGVGKTTFASQFPRPLFIATEAGTGHLNTFDAVCDSWPKFLEICKELATQNHGFETIVIDTLDNLWKMCRDRINAQNKIQHEQDLAFGKGSGLILREFERVLDKLSKLPVGLVLITHTEIEEVTPAKGRPFSKFVTAVPKKPRKYVAGLVDVILFATTEQTEDDQRRVIRTDSSPDYTAKDRTGKLPAVFPLHYDSFAAAFGGAVIEKKEPDRPPDKPKPNRQPAQDSKPWERHEATRQ